MSGFNLQLTNLKTKKEVALKVPLLLLKIKRYSRLKA